MTQKQLILKHLRAGHSLTPSAAKRVLGISALSKRVAELRLEGHCIYKNRQNGKVSYRLGKPSRMMVSAAFVQYGASVFE